MSQEPQPDSPSRWLRLGHLSLSDLLVETFSVLLGVLLALLINNVVQARQTRHKVAEAQSSIRAELEGDRKRLTVMNEYYHLINGKLDQAQKAQHPLAHCDDLPEWKGLITPLLLHASYDSAASSGVFADMPFGQTSRIAGLYAELARYETFAFKVEDWMVSRSLASRGEGFEARGCHGFLSDLEHSALTVRQDLDAYLGSNPAAP
jgi:hypothetical protein